MRDVDSEWDDRNARNQLEKRTQEFLRLLEAQRAEQTANSGRS